MLRFQRSEERQVEREGQWYSQPEVTTETPAEATARSAVSQQAAEATAALASATRGKLATPAQSAVVSQTATQKRRATRRQKTALVTLLVASAVGARWLVANAPTTTNYQPRVEPFAAAPKTLTAPNARHFYAAAADTVSESLEDFSHEDIPLAEKRAAVATAAPALDLLQQGTRYDYYAGATNFYVARQPLHTLDSPVPNYVRVRMLARLLAARSGVLAADGRHAAAVQAALDVARYGQHIGRGGSLIDGMIGILVEKIGVNEARERVANLSAAEARVALAALNRRATEQRNFGQIMEAERRTVMDGVSDVFSGDATGFAAHMDLGLNLGSSPLGRLAWNAGYAASVFWYGKQGLSDAANAYLDEQVRRGTLPYQEARNLSITNLPPVPYVFKNAMSSTKRARWSHTESIALRNVLRAELAVRAYRLEHGGKLPATLAELTVGPFPYLEEVPTDPFSRDGAQPLLYRDGKPYSVGDNGRDEGSEGDDVPRVYETVKR
jgi:hypothetical protein